jgi:UDPglucose 6-dehydrogenase
VDFNNPSRIILGGRQEALEPLQKLYRERFPHVTIINTDSESAEFTKYACNCFYAVKISILNEFKQLVENKNLDWNSIMSGMLSSGWINPMHTLVPGTDGNYGFGGKCFPKDLNAFINYFEDCGMEPLVMKASWRKNLQVRKNKDWMRIDGAYSNKNKKG